MRQVGNIYLKIYPGLADGKVKAEKKLFVMEGTEGHPFVCGLVKKSLFLGCLPHMLHSVDGRVKDAAEGVGDEGIAGGSDEAA